MKLMYVDEAGDLGQLNNPAHANDQPVFVLGGLILDSRSIPHINKEFLALKRRFYPNLPYPKRHHLDSVLAEVKGSDVKKNALATSRKLRRHALGFLDKCFVLLEQCEAKLVARVWVKEAGVPLKQTAVYTFSIQDLCKHLDHFSANAESVGLCIADARTKQLNAKVAHAIFTRVNALEASYGRLAEVPVFGHSDNHVGLQLSDIVFSGVVFPIACWEYCRSHVSNCHTKLDATPLADALGHRLKAMQYRYPGDSGKHSGGIVLSDPIGHRNASKMFGRGARPVGNETIFRNPGASDERLSGRSA